MGTRLVEVIPGRVLTSRQYGSLSSFNLFKYASTWLSIKSYIFSKIAEHFDREFDTNRFEQIAKLVSKETVRQKTRHDKKTVQLDNSYEVQRKNFRKFQGGSVWRTLLNDRPYLVNYFVHISQDDGVLGK